MGVNGHLLNLISSFLAERTHHTTVDKHPSDTLQPENGTPQGSALSMINFLIYFNDSITETSVIKSGLFVDDASLYGSGNRMPALIDEFNSSFKSIHKWSLTNSVIFDPVKFKILDLTGQQIKAQDGFWS